MKSNYLAQVLSFGLLTMMVSACSSNKLAVQNNNDDVYFSDVRAHQADYAVAVAPKTNNYPNDYSASPNAYDLGNDYYSSNYYWMNNNNSFYSPYWSPSYFNDFNSFYGSGLSFSLGYNNYPSYYGYNNWNFYNGFNNYYPYTGIYSYYDGYNSGYYGIYGYNPYYSNYPTSIYTVNPRPSNPRPNGAYDNMRPTNSRIADGTNPISRPIRPDVYNPRNSGRTVESTRNPNTPTSRPVRPTATPRPTSIPSRQTENRPTRSERPFSPPPSSSGSSSGGSTSSGSNGGGRPVRPGGH